MDGNKDRMFDSGTLHGGEDDADLRRGPWTVEEDIILINYIHNHGDGRWNSLARCAGNPLFLLCFLSFYHSLSHIGICTLIGN